MFYREGLLAPRPTTKLEDHPLSAVHDCLFNLFTATLHKGGRSSIRNLRTRHAVVTGTHYTERRRLRKHFYVPSYKTKVDARQSYTSMLKNIKEQRKYSGDQGPKWQARYRSNRKDQIPKPLLCVSIQL